MTTINADPTQPTTLTLTGPNDANVADASDVNVPFQSLLNNDARVATFYQSDLTALAALTGQQPNERIYVLGYGLYRYNQGGTNATVLPKYVAAAGGTGRWEWELATAAGVGLGVLLGKAGSQVSTPLARVGGGAMALAGVGLLAGWL